MQYEFRGKSLTEAVSRAVCKTSTLRLSHKGSDSDRTTIRSGRSDELEIYVKKNETYTVSWSARSSNEDDYSIRIHASPGMGYHEEVFSGEGSWSFSTGNYEGKVEIGIEFTYAYSALRRLDVSVR